MRTTAPPAFLASYCPILSVMLLHHCSDRHGLSHQPVETERVPSTGLFALGYLGPMHESRHLTVLFLLVGMGCDRPGSAGQSPAPERAAAGQPRVTANAQPPTVVAQPTKPGAGTFGPLIITPPVTLPNGSVPVHASLIGWTEDSQLFGYCGAAGPAMVETRCFEAGLGGVEKPIDQATRGTHASKAAAGQVPTWRYGTTLRLIWEIQPPAFLPDGPPHRAATFALRGGVVGETPSYVLDRVVLVPDNPDLEVHADAITPSPDGSAVGVVLHGFSGEWTDRYQLKIWSTEDLASRTFNAIGIAHHASEEYEKAAEFFQLAIDAADSSKASYNLACALARLGDPRARAALEHAVAVGGAEVLQKARADSDFDGIRKESWFAILVRR